MTHTYIFDEDMLHMSETNLESLRIRARREKAMALEKYKAGDLSGAKASASNAMMMNPFLTGVTRLNTVLDVLLGAQKKINGEVDWHAVLSVDPRANIATIQRRNKELLLSIIMDDGDDSLGSRIDEAKKILDDCRRFFCDESRKRLYDKRRQERAGREKQQRLKGASQGPSPSNTSFTYNPVTSNQPQSVSTRNELMVQPSLGVSGQVSGFTVTPVILSASLSNGEKKQISDVKVGQHFRLSRISVDDLRRATHVSSLVQPKPVVNPRRLEMFAEENEELVEVTVEQFVQPPIPVSSPSLRGSGGESKRKAPTDVLHENQLRRISEDPGVTSIEGRRENLVPSVIKSSLERFISDSQHVNVASSSEIKPPQESNKAPSHTEGKKKLVSKGDDKRILQAYPKKGQVWAIDTNSTSKEVVNKYEIVEVLEDFDNITGVTVAPLVKVPGYEAVFRRLPIPKSFSLKKLFRFSHKVASAKKGKNTPKGCLELDPRAMPPELLNVSTEEEMKIL